MRSRPVSVMAGDTRSRLTSRDATSAFNADMMPALKSTPHAAQTARAHASSMMSPCAYLGEGTSRSPYIETYSCSSTSCTSNGSEAMVLLSENCGVGDVRDYRSTQRRSYDNHTNLLDATAAADRPRSLCLLRS